MGGGDDPKVAPEMKDWAEVKQKAEGDLQQMASEQPWGAKGVGHILARPRDLKVDELIDDWLEGDDNRGRPAGARDARSGRAGQRRGLHSQVSADNGDAR